MPRSDELRTIAQAIADALPPTVEVTEGELELEECFAFAAACGLTDLGTWGPQGVPTKRVSGYRDGVPIELIWWSHAHAETAIDAVFAGDPSTTADAIANGVALRKSRTQP